MFSVLIVDDEMLIRAKLKSIINWEENDFFICGEATNGLEALKLIKEKKPDMVLTDVKMPVMDGLQLSNEMKEKYPDIKFIALSNYDEFKYVKSMLKNGAVDYILKHELNVDTLLDALNRAKDSIKNSMNIDGRSNADNRSIDSLISLRKKFVIQLLLGTYRDEHIISDFLDTLDIKIDTKNVAVVLMAVDNYKSSLGQKDLGNISILEYSIVNILQEVLDDYGNGVISHITNGEFAIILSYSHFRSKVQIDNRMNEILRRISNCLKEFMNISASYSISDICTSIINLSKSYENINMHMQDRFYLGKNCVIKNDLHIVEKESLEGLNIDFEKRILSYTKIKDYPEVYSIINHIFDDIIFQKLSETSYGLIFGDLLSIINRLCKENHIDISRIYSNRESPHQMLAKLETIDETRKWFLELFRKLFDSLNSGCETVSSDYVREAIRYINQNYSRQISLSDVARYVDISSAYLSTLFKDETGASFCDYVTNIRLEKAKALLVEGKLNLKDIVQSTGFSDYSYFIKTFKKKTGVTPKVFTKTGF